MVSTRRSSNPSLTLGLHLNSACEIQQEPRPEPQAPHKKSKTTNSSKNQGKPLLELFKARKPKPYHPRRNKKNAALVSSVPSGVSNLHFLGLQAVDCKPHSSSLRASAEFPVSVNRAQVVATTGFNHEADLVIISDDDEISYKDEEADPKPTQLVLITDEDKSVAEGFSNGPSAPIQSNMGSPDIILISDDDVPSQGVGCAHQPPSPDAQVPKQRSFQLFDEDDVIQAENPPVNPVSSQLFPPHVFPPLPQPHYTRFNHIRDLIQARVLIRELLGSVGEFAVTSCMERCRYPIPTLQQIFREELHAHWIERGDYYRLPMTRRGTLMVSIPSPDVAIVRSETQAGPVWAPTLPATTIEVELRDLMGLNNPRG